MVRLRSVGTMPSYASMVRQIAGGFDPETWPLHLNAYARGRQAPFAVAQADGILERHVQLDVVAPADMLGLA